MRQPAAALAVLVTLALAACPPTDEARDSLTLGAVNPATGALAAYGPSMENGILLALAEVDAAGGVLDADLEVAFRDSKTDPAAAAAAASELVELGVPAIIGAAGSGNTIAVSEVTVAAGIPLITGASTSPALTDLDDADLVFRTAPSDAFQGVVLADEVYADGHREVGVMHIENAYGQGLAAVFTSTFTALGGTVVVTHGYAENLDEGHDYQTDLDTLYAASPEAIVLVGYLQDGISILKAWNNNGGYTGAWYLTDGTKSRDLPANVGSAAVEGIEGTAPVLGSGSAYETFSATYTEQFGAAPGVFAEHYYDATVLLALALAKAGRTDGAALRDALREVASPPGTVIGAGEVAKGLEEIAAGRDVNYEGASGPVDFDEKGDVAGAIEIWKYEAGETVRVRVVEPDAD